MMNNDLESLEKISVEALDKILGKPFQVLDDGFVRVIDYLGNDSAIVQAARVAYGQGTKKMREDRELIRYLIRHMHTSPFEMCEIKLHVRVPMDTWRQWIRHRTANVNEYSTRYSLAIDSAQKTQPHEWRLQSKGNRQGSAGNPEPHLGKELTLEEEELQALARNTYSRRIEAGIAREQARKDLPLSTYTEAYWKIDLNNLLHFLQLRMEENAQYEIRCYANAIGNEIVRLWCPLAWEAFLDYRVGSLSFSRLECELLKHIHDGQPETAVQLAAEMGWLSRKEGVLKSVLERTEFEAKCQRLQLPLPWE
jgi:thymidylate synthase (FAD)